MKINKKWVISLYTYVIFLWIVLITWGIMTWTILLRHFSTETLAKTKSFYASETGVEEWLLAFKRDPIIDNFVPNEAIIYEAENMRDVEYKEQKIYKKELFIEDLIPAWKSIQLPFAKKDLDSRITKFHIAILKYDWKTKPTWQLSCETPLYNAAVEVSAYQKANIIATEPLEYFVELSSNWNGCYLWNNPVWKSSLLTYSDPYSNEKVSLIWDKCIVNAWTNVDWSVFERRIPYTFNDWGDVLDLSTNKCDLNCWTWLCSNYYTYDQDIRTYIQWYQTYYTVANNFIWSDMSDTWLIMFNLRAINEDAHVALWATDDVWNAYEIPWRYIYFSALWITQWWDLEEWLFTRLKLKKKHNDDLLSIFDYSLFSESEFIK